MPKTKAAEPEPRYRWSSPQEWLLEKITETNNRHELRKIIRELLGHCDNDGVQDSFQSDMDQDGYFQDLNKRAFACGCCDGYHPHGWEGDCRDDQNRMEDLPEGWEEVDEDAEV